MAGHIVVHQDNNQHDEDNAVYATRAQKRDGEQGGAMTAGHDELIVNGESQQRDNEKDQYQIRDGH